MKTSKWYGLRPPAKGATLKSPLGSKDQLRSPVSTSGIGKKTRSSKVKEILG